MDSDGGRSVHFDEDEQDAGSPSPSPSLLGDDSAHHNLRRRRSSITMRLNAFAQVGGVNSIQNFTQSWTRAAVFLEVAPRRPSFILSTDSDTQDEEETIHYGRVGSEEGMVPRASLLRAHLEASSPSDAIDDDTFLSESDPNTPRPLNHKESEAKRLGSDLISVHGSMRGIPPHFTTPLVGSYGTSYGTVSSMFNESTMTQANRLWRQQQNHVEGERSPLIVKEVEQDGKIVLAIAGQSTLPQTILNSTNVLIGVGLLSLPMGIKYAGWLLGTVFLLLSAITTAYTAKLLAKCLDVDASLISFADIAFISYGSKARLATSVLFTIELLAACVALIVLFADTLNLLFPKIGILEWKIICGFILIPLNFLPLRLLSVSSFLGIFSCFCIVLVIFFDGLVKPETPGSLRMPAETYMFPANWLTLPLSFGLLMSPWGGHSVFPNIYRDMRHPKKYHRAVKSTFIFTYLLDMATAAAGYSMFGDLVMTEITANILRTKGYPHSLDLIISICIAIIPLTKVPLNCRPIISLLDSAAGLNSVSIAQAPALNGISSYIRGILIIVNRIVVIVIFVIIAIVFPEFDSIMAFMGSTLCFTICIILPIMFYLKIFGKEISTRERVLDYFLVGVCSVLAVVGTVFAFLPKSLIGAK